jgi:hypothetical protein
MTQTTPPFDPLQVSVITKTTPPFDPLILVPDLNQKVVVMTKTTPPFDPLRAES